jgi:hypothetical protein
MPPFAPCLSSISALAERDPERLSDDAGDDIGAAARPERHDDVDRPARIALCPRRERHRCRAADQGDEIAPPQAHRLAPPSVGQASGGRAGLTIT